ncbi:2-succinyl-5-enolpyruvyl-6-hydroxy-3-cyclohexene-1-carboxylic-acid synthase [Aquirufa sp. OSTEICH-129V]|uniref:2-succinyl-5-enolpyruvyl-6-hydroxy-3-cyclohexene-1-carboxylate synthase n=1 Tax=Aquirufa avitistagni TaxID=3104728 RepID=A0ABW6DCQ3_9BACT
MRLFFAMAYPEGLVDLIDNLHQQGVNEAVICPGSRNAPIMLAMVRHGGFRCYSISDERSAGFFGLGRALKTKRPVIICCTSGSAGLNFAPAVVEAFFQEIPLIVLTADRPAEWIGQWDGQTIYQENLFGKHVKHAESFKPFQPNQLVEKAMAFPQGPVHMNVPIAEPFYPTNGEALPQIREPQAIEAHKTPELDTDFQVKQGASLLITVGQRPFHQAENDFFAQLALNGIPVIGDATANLPAECQLHHDLIWANEVNLPSFQPEFHIHFGKSFVSKRIKQFLRTYKPTASWLVHPNPIGKPDPFQCLTRVVRAETISVLTSLCQQTLRGVSAVNSAKNRLEAIQEAYFKKESWSELAIYNHLIGTMDSPNSEVHVANSLAIRYINWTENTFTQSEVFSNRGTSGIDGCLSTAIGASQQTNKLVISLIGDVAFQYDRNALWNAYVGANVRIIIFNNSGGGIFGILDGAKDLPELDEFMVTKQVFRAKNTALDAGIDYFEAYDWNELHQQMQHFGEPSDRAKILEIFTDSAVNTQELQAYMRLFKQ